MGVLSTRLLLAKMASFSPSTLLFLLLISSSRSALPASAPAPAGGILSGIYGSGEQDMLMIKELLIDPQGVLRTWDPDTLDPCLWTFVTCSPDKLVTGLEAPGHNLSGCLSPSIGNLTDLESLLLQSNNITGSIPAEVGKFAKLKKLSLSRNHVYGQIPSSVAHLKSLQYLDLSYNNLNGPIPRPLAGKLKAVILSFLVGNPLICAANTGQDCSRTSPLPMSSNLKISQAGLPSAKTKSHKFAVALSSTIACAIFLSFPIP